MRDVNRSLGKKRLLKSEEKDMIEGEACCMMALGGATGDERLEQSIARVPKERVEDIEIPRKGVKVITRIEDARARHTRLEGCLQLNDDLCAVVDRIWQGAYGEPCLIGGVQFLRIFEGKLILQATVKPQ